MRPRRPVPSPGSAASLLLQAGTLEEIGFEMIRRTVQTAGNISEASKQLSTHRHGIYRKL